MKVYSLKNLLKERKHILQHVIMSLHQWKCLHVLVKHRAGSHPDLLRWSADLCWPFVTDAVFLSRFLQAGRSKITEWTRFPFNQHQFSLLLFHSNILSFLFSMSLFLNYHCDYCSCRPRKPYCSAGTWFLRWCQAATSSRHTLVLVHVLLTPPTHPRAGNKQSFLPTSVNKNVVSATLSGGWMRVDGAQKCRRSKRKRDCAFETFPSQNTSKYIYMRVFVTPPGASAER